MAALRREVFEAASFQILSASFTGAFGGRDFRRTNPNGDQDAYKALLYRCEVPVSAAAPRTQKL